MPYPGGKGGAGVCQAIINLMPPHQVYIEPFLGNATVMRMKRPAALNIGLDRDPESPGLVWLDSTANRAGQYWGEDGDGIAYLETHGFLGNELVYCDPPYLMETRRSGRLYECEMETLEHRRLLRILKALPCMVMISGYWSRMYADALKGWRSIHFQAMTRGGRPATEWVWFNFAPPAELHDYRYLGANFRERERIGRKKRRWVERLGRMPLLERQALLAAIAGIDGSSEGIRA